jgi:fructose-bisphosphate aldolase, class I
MTAIKKVTLSETIALLTTRGKGILACDESPRSMGRRFEALAIAPSFEMREKFFSMLFETEGLGQSVSGVILYEDMLGDQAVTARLKAVLDQAGIMIGVRADQGLVPFPGFPHLGLTSGIDSIRTRLEGYAKAGARFVKWRAAFSGTEVPGADVARKANAVNLALYALAAIEHGLVPIVEVEIEMEGDHGVAECAAATRRALRELFQTLEAYRIGLNSLVLKTNFIVPGKEAAELFDAATSVEATVALLSEVVPASVPLVAFLSGGQSSDVSISLLKGVGKSKRPWATSFSFGRALWMDPLTLWAGKDDRSDRASLELARTARRCAEAAA